MDIGVDKKKKENLKDLKENQKENQIYLKEVNLDKLLNKTITNKIRI